MNIFDGYSLPFELPKDYAESLGIKLSVKEDNVSLALAEYMLSTFKTIAKEKAEKEQGDYF